MTDTINTVAVGDIHGSYDKLVDVLESYRDSGLEMVFLGDLIDRAPQPDGDIKVVKTLHDLQKDPSSMGLSKVTVLKGNHESFFLDLLGNPSTKMMEHWLYNGGDPDLLEVAGPFVAWLYSLPTTYIKGKYLFVHAGVEPGVPLEEQDKEQMRWIREPFLSQDHGLPYVVVHGHTVTADMKPEVLPWRIACDLGACFGGPLCAYELAA